MTLNTRDPSISSLSRESPFISSMNISIFRLRSCQKKSFIDNITMDYLIRVDFFFKGRSRADISIVKKANFLIRKYFSQMKINTLKTYDF